VRAIVLLTCLAVAGCVEVTRFTGPEGDVYLADCDNPVRLQSCRAALESVCPNGYDLVQTVTRDQEGQRVPTKSGYFRCR
jgi:hypothetical protein